MTYQLFAFAGLILEFVAVNLIHLRISPLQLTCSYLAVHAAASIMASIALWRILPQKYRHPRVWVVCSLASFGFFTLTLGLVCLVLACLIVIRYRKEHAQQEIKSVATPPFMVEAQVHLSQFGEGGVRARLVNSSAPKQLRVKALLAMEGVSGHTSNDVIRIAMQDEDDEVRLLAFGMLDSRENELNTKINSLLRSLETEGISPNEAADIHLQIAQLYWELVYQELVRDSLMEYAIERAFHHAAQCSEILTEAPGIHVLLGRLQMQTRDFPSARESFNRALSLGIQESRVVPYLAELAYLDRDFAEVNRLLASNPSFNAIPALAQVVAFWGEAS